METKRIKVRWVEYEYDLATFNIERAWFQYGLNTVNGYEYSAAGNIIRFVCMLFEKGPYCASALSKVTEARHKRKKWHLFGSKNEDKIPVVILKDGADAEIAVSPERMTEIYEDISVLNAKIRDEANSRGTELH